MALPLIGSFFEKFVFEFAFEPFAFTAFVLRCFKDRTKIIFLLL
jgi:hypothetical protein